MKQHWSLFHWTNTQNFNYIYLMCVLSFFSLNHKLNDLFVFLLWNATRSHSPISINIYRFFSFFLSNRKGDFFSPFSKGSLGVTVMYDCQLFFQVCQATRDDYAPCWLATDRGQHPSCGINCRSLIFVHGP